MVAEDNWLLRQEIVETLKGLGWTCWRWHRSGRVHLSSPGRNNPPSRYRYPACRRDHGWDVAEGFRAADSRISVIYTSGNPSNDARCVAHSIFFSKPVAIPQFTLACRNLLAAIEFLERPRTPSAISEPHLALGCSVSSCCEICGSRRTRTESAHIRSLQRLFTGHDAGDAMACIAFRRLSAERPDLRQASANRLTLALRVVVGQHSHLANLMSSISEGWRHGPVLEAGGVRFRLWAPAHAYVSLVLDGRGDELPMTPRGGGWFEAFAAGCTAGDRYRFLLSDGTQIPDPASRFQPKDVHGPSEVVDPSSFRRRSSWRGRPWTETVLYELHVGAFTPEGTFEAAARRIPRSRRSRSDRDRLDAG